MKKILSVIVSLVMSVGLLSVNVHAALDPYIVINDTFYYETSASGDGWTFSREGKEGKLILTNASIIAGEEAIASYYMNLTIDLSGSNKVSITHGVGVGISSVSGDVTIQGNGSLDVSGTAGINVLESGGNGHLTITGNCTVTVTASRTAICGQSGITIDEGLGIIAPEGGRINDSGEFIVDKDGNIAKEATIGPTTVTITFDANGASSVPEPQTIVKGGKATQPGLYVYDNDLYVLGGWYDNADFLGDPVDFRYKTFDSDTTLYASWERPVEVQVGIWGEGDSSAPIEFITVNGVKFPNKVAALVYSGLSTQRGCPISVDAVISEGYGFVEVVKDSDGTHLSDELPYTNKNDDTSWDEHAIAIWLLFGPLKTITFVDEDGTVLQESEVAAGRTPEYTGDTPTKKEDSNYTYTFAGWDPEITTVTDDATYTATYTRKKKSSSSNSSSTTTTDNTWTDTSSTTSSTTTYTPPVTPSYRPQSTTTAYTVWFETDGGTEIAYQTVAAGTTASRPYDPEKEGYLFDGWYSDKELTEEFNFLTPINANTTVYAKWAEPEEPEEIIPEPAEEPESAEPEPAEPENKSSKPWMWPLLALILAVLGAGGWKLSKKG